MVKSQHMDHLILFDTFLSVDTNLFVQISDFTNLVILDALMLLLVVVKV
jgi:hypothetical protein